MPWDELLDNLARLPPSSHGPWLRGAAGVAAVVALLLWLERWYFARAIRACSVRTALLQGSLQYVCPR